MGDEYSATDGDSNPDPPSGSRSKIIVRVLITIYIVAVLYVVLQPALMETPGHRGRTPCKNNLKLIGIALHNYHETYGRLPPAYTVDEQGNRLHSWRTLILPFLGRDDLYAKIDLSKPWDDSANAGVFEQPISEDLPYRCHSAGFEKTQTSYQVVVSPESIFYPGQSRRLRDIKDGTANTIMVTEVPEDQAVHWMSPYDVSEEAFLGINKESDLSHEGGMQTVYADGSVRFVYVDTPVAERRAMITIAGDDTPTEKSE